MGDSSPGRKKIVGNGNYGKSDITMHEVLRAFIDSAKSEVRIRELLMRVDIQLACLSAAIAVNHANWINLCKINLNVLRAELIRLEYYPMA